MSPGPKYVPVWTLPGWVLWPGGPPPHPLTPHPVTLSPSRLWFLPADSSVERLREKTIHSVGRQGTRDPILVIPVPHSSWNLNANLIAVATESLVIKRAKKHLYCYYASWQNVSWNRKWKQPLCSIYRSLYLNIAKCYKVSKTWYHTRLLLAL